MEEYRDKASPVAVLSQPFGLFILMKKSMHERAHMSVCPSKKRRKSK